MDQTRIVPAADTRPAPLETVQVLELEADGEADGDWITRVLRSGLFRHLTPEHSHRFFAELEPVSVRAGQVVVEQGAPGEHFYVVTQGRCAVTRQVPGSNRELQLNVLREGDTFGDASLISGTPRMTTVRMLSNGTLMRLGHNRFAQLVAAPMLSFVSYDEARRLVSEGALWLDVRQGDQGSEDAFDESLSVPHHVLSIEASKLDSAKTYVVYCENGANSATGAFFLTRLGFDAHVLDGGLVQLHADTSGSVEQVPGSPDDAPSAQEMGPPTTFPVGEQEPGSGAGDAEHGAGVDDGPAGGDEVTPTRAALVTPAQVEQGAIITATRAEERARVLARQNSALMRFLEVQRENHRVVERRFDEERGTMASALSDAKAHMESVLETRRSLEVERSRLEQLLKQADGKLLQANIRLTETTDRLLESDRNLSRTGEKLDEVTGQISETKASLLESETTLSSTMMMLAEANARLTATTVKLVETSEKLSRTQARVTQLERELTAFKAEDSGTDTRHSNAKNTFATFAGELAETQARLTTALSENSEVHAARERAELALEVALGELRGHAEGLATLRSALTGAADGD